MLRDILKALLAARFWFCGIFIFNFIHILTLHPGQMPLSTASCLVLHCLPMPLKRTLGLHYS